MAYRDEYLRAEQRTASLGMAYVPLPHVGTLVLEPVLNDIPQMMFDTFGLLGLEDLVGRCIEIHHRLKEPMQMLSGSPAQVTVGTVHYAGGALYPMSDALIQTWLAKGVGNRAPLHVWLTFASMEILDASLATTLSVWNKADFAPGQMIARPADDLTVRYEPWVVGTEFLRQIGVPV